MVEVKRTLVKSPPELWQVVDDRELMGRTSAELFGSHAIEVVEREPGKRLAWRVSDAPEARVELGLAEKDWGTQVAIRVGERGGSGQSASAVLERLLDQLGSDQRRPLRAPERGSGSGEAAPHDQDEEGAAGGIEATLQGAVRDATDRAAASPERRPVARLEEMTAKLERRSLERLAELTRCRASEQIEGAIRAAEERLDRAGERLRSEAEEAHRRARARIEEAERGSSRNERQRELALAQRERDKSVQVAEQRLAKQAAEIFARLEREVGRLQERARRIVAAAASKEVERRVQSSVESALRDIEERLTATMRGGVGGGMTRRADTGARRPATERSARRPEPASSAGGRRLPTTP
jgi:hypothetical protein